MKLFYGITVLCKKFTQSREKFFCLGMALLIDGIKLLRISLGRGNINGGLGLDHKDLAPLFQRVDPIQLPIVRLPLRKAGSQKLRMLCISAEQKLLPGFRQRLFAKTLVPSKNQHSRSGFKGEITRKGSG